GLAYNAAEPFWWVVFHGGFGGWVFDEDLNPTLDDEATENAMQFVHDLRYKHRIIPGESDYDLMDSLFKEGKAAFIINGDWSYGEYADAENIDLGVASIPMFNETGLYGQPMTSGTSYIMMAELPEQEQIATIKFIEFMTSEEAQNMFIEENMFLPANKHAYDHPLITENHIMAGSAEQLQNGRPMPVVAEMRAIWDAIRPSLQRVMSDDLDPADAPAQMQRRAEDTIEDMR
ncbi:extracellular solute-binding protein, partial [Halonatronum saccharophilum]